MDAKTTNENNTEQIRSLINAIENGDDAMRELKKMVDQLDQQPEISREDRLLTSKQIAEMLQVSDVHFRNRIATRPDFPTAVRLPSPNGVKKRLRWFYSEIIDWIKGNRSQ